MKAPSTHLYSRTSSSLFYLNLSSIYLSDPYNLAPKTHTYMLTQLQLNKFPFLSFFFFFCFVLMSSTIERIERQV